MHARRILTVSITPEQDALVRSCVASGRFASVSEVVRAALRLLERAEIPPPERQAKPATEAVGRA